MNYLINNQIAEAEDLIREILPFCKDLGIDYIVTAAKVLRGAVLVGKGRLSSGIKILGKDLGIFEDNGRLFSLYVMETALAEIYFRIAIRAQALNLIDVIKNLGFIITILPFSRRRAEAYLNKIIQVGREVESQGFVQGQALLNLGCLHRLNGKMASARECFAEALQILERCTSETYLQQAREALASVS